MNSKEIELAVAREFNTRINLIVPNVFWGLGFNYELDLMIVTKAHYAYEVEIKISISDLKAEKKKKPWAHHDKRIKGLYFAIPDDLKEKAIPLIDKNAGILTVYGNCHDGLHCSILRKPTINNNARKLTDTEMRKLYSLCAMRVWNLKEHEVINTRKIATATAANVRTEKALALINEWGSIGGGYRKQWVLDQLVQTLADDYAAWIADFEGGINGPHTFIWDAGRRPLTASKKFKT